MESKGKGWIDVTDFDDYMTNNLSWLLLNISP